MNKITLLECSRKKLDETYIAVYAIKNIINIKKGDYIEKCDVYTFIGIDVKGYRQFINIYFDKVNNKSFWLECFESFKSRGLKNILFLSVDDNKNMKRTAKIAFPNISFSDSLTDIIPKFYKYSPEKDVKKLAIKVRMLYTQKTLTEFKHEFDSFKKLYNNVIQQKLIEKYLTNIETFYKYSQNIRHLLFKHCANMELYDRIRLSFNNNSNYITSLEELYTKIEENTKTFGFISFKKGEWLLILNDIIQIYPDIDFI